MTAKRGTKVAVLLSVIVRDSSSDETPINSMDADRETEGAEGFNIRGWRTHYYLAVS
jgi:hypothetical protein